MRKQRQLVTSTYQSATVLVGGWRVTEHVNDVDARYRLVHVVVTFGEQQQIVEQKKAALTHFVFDKHADLTLLQQSSCRCHQMLAMCESVAPLTHQTDDLPKSLDKAHVVEQLALQHDAVIQQIALECTRAPV